MAFKRLVRFNDNGQAKYGDLVGSNSGYHWQVAALQGNPWDGLTATGRVLTTSKRGKFLEIRRRKSPELHVLAAGPPRTRTNYHLRGVKLQAALFILQSQVPTYPVFFTKPSDALNGPTDEVHVHPDAQIQLDYEGELCVVISRDVNNVSEANALDYVLGYTAGKDVSARNFQVPAASGGKFCYAKSFDGFAPNDRPSGRPRLCPIRRISTT